MFVYIWDLLKIANIGGGFKIIGEDSPRRAIHQIDDTLYGGANKLLWN